MTNTINISSMLPWGEVKVVNTRYGVRHLRKATPTPAFWTAWRAHRAELDKAGVSLQKDKETNEWQVCWWMDPKSPTTDCAISNPEPETQPKSQPVTETAPAPKPVAAVPMSRKDFKWSVEQQAIFNEFKTGKRPFIVIARAGSGKTTTAKEGFSLAPEQDILYVVFNTKNRVEAEEKISDPRVRIKTWNGLGFMFVRQVWPKATPNDDVEFDRVEKACGKDTPSEVKSAVLKLVGFAKNTAINPTVDELVEICRVRNIDAEAYEDEINGGWSVYRLAHSAAEVLKLSLEQDPENRISFNDQVWLPVVKGWVRAMFDLALADEAQDMNAIQLAMFKKIVRPGGRHAMIGDDRQSIYYFRGADSEGMFRTKAELNMKELKLTVSRRSPKAALPLVTPIVPDFRVADDAIEGLVETVAETAIVQMAKPGDAIISRINAPLMAICLRFLKVGIPARIEGRDIGKTLSAVVKKLNARTVPQFLTKLENWAAKQKNRFKDTKNYERKCEEINDTWETLAAVAEGAASVTEIGTRLETLFQDTKAGSPAAVVCSSAHKAKGLEWDNVFMLHRTFNRKRPAMAPAPTPAEVKEEQNLLYVTYTRFRKRLSICVDVAAAPRG